MAQMSKEYKLKWYHDHKQLTGRQWYPCSTTGCEGTYNWSRDRICHRCQKALDYQRHKSARMQLNYSWSARNRPKKNAIQQRQRATEGTFTSEAWEALVALFGHLCAYCRLRFNQLEVDHIIPTSKGGRHNAGNIVPSCRSCNARKGNRCHSLAA